MGGLVAGLAAIVGAAATAAGQPVPAGVTDLVSGATSNAGHAAAAKALIDGERSLILFGLEAAAHDAFSELRLLGAALSQLTGATVGYLSEGANGAGLSLAGVLPHRAAAGRPRTDKGRSVGDMLERPPACLLLWNVEPAVDLAAFGPDAGKSVDSAGTVIACTPYFGESVAAHADIVLPIGTFAETAGTFVNVEGRAQSWQGIAKPVGEARPGWKILRVLGTELGVPEFEFNDAAEVSRSALAAIEIDGGDNAYGGAYKPRRVNGEDAPASAYGRPIYEVDATVRRAPALQLTSDGQAGRQWRDALGDGS